MLFILVLLLASPALADGLPAITRPFQKTRHTELTHVLGAWAHRHQAEVTAVRWSPDGRSLLTSATDGTVRLWNAAQDPMAIFPIARSRVHALAVSADGATVAAGGVAPRVSLFDVASGKRTEALGGHGGTVVATAFSPDGARLVTAATDARLRVWDVRAGTLLHDERTRVDPIAAAFSVDGRAVVALLADGALVRWEPGRRSEVSKRRGHRLDAGAFSADRSIAVAAGGGKLWLADAAGAFTLVARAAGDVTAVAVSADGSRAITGDHRGRLTLYDPVRRARLWSVPAHDAEITSVDISADGKRALTGSRDYRFRTWDLATGDVVAPLPSHEAPAYALAVVGDDLAVAGGDGTVRLWRGLAPHGRVGGMRGGVFAVAGTRDGRLLTGGDDGKLRLWTADAAGPAHSEAAHPGGIFALAIHGERAVSAGHDGKLRLWELARLRERRALPISARPLTAVAVHPAGRLAAAAGEDGLVYRVDLDTGASRASGGPRGPIHALAWSGEAILAAGDDGELRVHPDAGAPRSIARHDGPVRALAICPGGRCLISGGADGTLRLWSPGGDLLDTIDLSSLRDSPQALAFLPDGSLACATRLGVTLVFRVSVR